MNLADKGRCRLAVLNAWVGSFMAEKKGKNFPSVTVLNVKVEILVCVMILGSHTVVTQKQTQYKIHRNYIQMYFFNKNEQEQQRE